jgi:hypothetical protein
MRTVPNAAACLCVLLYACSGTRISNPTVNGTEMQITALTSCAVAPGYEIEAAETAPPTPTATLEPPTPTLPPSPTAFAAFPVSIWADNVNLRTNPGYLFPVIRILRQGTPLLLTGRAPGGEWYFAEDPDGVEGWVFGLLLDLDPRLAEVPIREPRGVQVLQGRVRDANGIPIQGVSFAVSQGTGPKAPTNVVHTDPSGVFFSFLPPESGGTWTVTHTGIACKSNVWKGDGCDSYKNGYRGLIDPPSLEVVLPHADPLEFLWT